MPELLLRERAVDNVSTNSRGLQWLLIGLPASQVRDRQRLCRRFRAARPQAVEWSDQLEVQLAAGRAIRVRVSVIVPPLRCHP